MEAGGGRDPPRRRGSVSSGCATEPESGEISVEFADGRSLAADGRDYPQIDGIEATATFATVAKVRIPVAVLQLRRGSLSCWVEVADIAQPLARVWSSQVAPSAVLTLTEHGGAGHADNTGLTLIADDALVRAAVWDDGAGPGSSRDDSRASALADDLLSTLVAAGAA
jgi:hypothetical protein